MTITTHDTGDLEPMSSWETVDLSFMQRHMPDIVADGISQNDLDSWLHHEGAGVIRAMAFAESLASSIEQPAAYDAIRCLCALIERGDSDYLRRVAVDMLRILAQSPQFDAGVICA